MRKGFLMKKGMIVTCAVAFFAVLAAVGSGGVLKGRVPDDANAQSAPAGLTKHVLSGTYFETNTFTVSASCPTGKCTATMVFPAQSIVCSGAAGTTCTYQVFARISGDHFEFG